MKKSIFIFILLVQQLLSVGYHCYSQIKIDTLLLSLKEADLKPDSYSKDTAVINLCNELSWQYWNKGKLAEALDFGEKALSASDKLKYKTGLASAYNNVGNVYETQSDYSKALDYYFQAVNVSEEIGDKESLADSYNNLGSIYLSHDDFPNALKYFNQSLKNYEAINNKRGIAVIFNNIAIVYDYQHNLKIALDYYFKSLKIEEETGDKGGLALSYTNIGDIYNTLYTTSIDTILNLFPQFKKLSTQEIKSAFLDSAWLYHSKSLTLAKEINDGYSMIYAYQGLGKVTYHRKKFPEALLYMEKAVAEGESLGAKKELFEIFESLAGLCNEMGKPNEAYKYQRLYSLYKDSVFNESNQKDIGRLEAGFEYEKQILSQQKEQEIKEAIYIEQERRQYVVLSSIIGGLILVLIFTVFIFNRFRVTRRQKTLIEQQKFVLEEKQKEIIDSINYAKKIQDALLNEEDIHNSKLPEHFILFKPKDIVSGDFYWSSEKQGYLYLCASDSTGHGVPGAFMSMLGIAYLNEINATEKVLEPSEILTQMRDKVVKELKQTGGTNETKDGMDMALIRLQLQPDQESREIQLQYSGANNPLWIIKSDETKHNKDNNFKSEIQNQKSFFEIKPDKQPIGYYPSPKSFTNHNINLNKGDTVYLFTDGYTDQFGGEKGKKFKYSQFKKLLLEISQLPMSEQKQKLSETVENWRGNLEQVDDICVIGVRL